MDKKLYIIAGSYHNFIAPEGKRYNTSLIFTPESAEPYLQYKLKSAVNEDEYCDVPISQTLTVVGTPYGNFVVLICIDVGIRDIWGKIGKLNSEQKYQGVQFIISPAFDPSFSVIEHAMAFSKTHKICVAFANSFEDRSISPSSQPPIFCKSDGNFIISTVKKKIIHI